ITAQEPAQQEQTPRPFTLADNLVPVPEILPARLGNLLVGGRPFFVANDSQTFITPHQPCSRKLRVHLDAGPTRSLIDTLGLDAGFVSHLFRIFIGTLCSIDDVLAKIGATVENFTNASRHPFTARPCDPFAIEDAADTLEPNPLAGEHEDSANDGR